MDISKNNFSYIQQISGQYVSSRTSGIKSVHTEETNSFEKILNQKAAGQLKFSKHANQRLASRNIDLSQAQLERLENGTSKARQKGICESLVMVDNLAFIVNTKNNTVVTAMNNTEENIFTNIDGAVIS